MKKTMKKRKLVSLLMAFVLLAGFLPGASAEVTEQDKQDAINRRNELQAQLTAINQKLSEISDAVDRAQEKASTYSTRKSIVQQQIEAIKESIDLKTEQCTLMQEELDDKIAQHEETYETFKKRLRAMYMSNDTSTLSAVLGASSFSEFLVGAESLRRVSEHDTELMKTLEREQKEIEETKAIIEEELDSLESDKEALDVKYNELAALAQEANAQLSSAEALEDVTEEERTAILDEYNKANAELNALMGTGSADYVGGYFAWPVPGFTYVSSGYGWRTLYGAANFHGGIDIAGGGIYGANVIASNDGTVIRALYYTTGYGYHVMLDHGGNNWTVYGHLSSIAVSYGQYVHQGETVGRVGSTGNSTGPHLHFEIRLNGERVNPLNYVSR